MKTPSNEILIYYHSDSRRGKQLYAYAKSIAKHVRAFDFKKNTLTTAMMQDLLTMMNTDAKSLMDKSMKDYRERVKGAEFDGEGWLNILIHHPELIRSPIAVYKNRAKLCESPTDIYSLTN